MAAILPTKSLTEKRAEDMAEKAGFSAAHHGRPYYMIGVMGSCAEELERVIDLIAKGKVRGSEARLLAANTLTSMSVLP